MKHRHPHHTERTIRGAKYWVKITRSNAHKKYFFSLGFNGCPKAFDTRSMTFTIIRTWYDAECYATLLQQR